MTGIHKGGIVLGMARRIIVGADDCVACIAQQKPNVFIEGYITGCHDVSKGDSANIPLCQSHTDALLARIAKHVRGGLIRR